MVKATELRNAILEAAVNPKEDVLWREIEALGEGAGHYFILRAIEKLQTSRRADPDNSTRKEIQQLLSDAITLIGIAKVHLHQETNEPTKTAKR